MKNYLGKVNLVCGQLHFWYALSHGKLMLQKNPRTLNCCDLECMVDGFTTTCTTEVVSSWLCVVNTTLCDKVC